MSGDAAAAACDRLYVLVHDDLTPAQRAVQGAHAVAQFMLEHPGAWANETLVILRTREFP